MSWGYRPRPNKAFGLMEFTIWWGSSTDCELRDVSKPHLQARLSLSAQRGGNEDLQSNELNS